MTNKKTQFRNEFEPRFLEIARLADKGDDIGCGKGLARLQIDIGNFIDRLESEKVKELKEMIDGMKCSGVITIKEDVSGSSLTRASSEQETIAYNQALADLLQKLS